MTSLQLMMQLVLFSTLALGLVYFLFYRPTVEAQRRARRVISDLEVGDEVVTSSGFFARVVGVSEPDDGPAVVTLDLGGGFQVRARGTAIAERLPRAEPQASVQPDREENRELRPSVGLEGGTIRHHAQ
jgi:preprotein translocase YajC subunit